MPLNTIVFVALAAVPSGLTPDARIPKTIGKNGSAANGSRVVTLDMLKSRTVDPAVVRDTVLHYLKNEKKLTSFNFVNLGMASSRYCDIHVVMEVLRVVRIHMACRGGQRSASVMGEGFTRGVSTTLNVGQSGKSILAGGPHPASSLLSYDNVVSRFYYEIPKISHHIGVYFPLPAVVGGKSTRGDRKLVHELGQKHVYLQTRSIYESVSWAWAAGHEEQCLGPFSDKISNSWYLTCRKSALNLCLEETTLPH